MKAKSYTVIEHRGPRELERHVNELMSHGWVPIGGVSITPGEQVGDHWNYAQALVHEEEGRS